MAQNSGYDQFPLAANGWGTIHHQDMAPRLQAKEKGPPTYKELIPGAIHAITFSPYDRHEQA
jgi:hypothetical protein